MRMFAIVSCVQLSDVYLNECAFFGKVISNSPQTGNSTCLMH